MPRRPVYTQPAALQPPPPPSGRRMDNLEDASSRRTDHTYAPQLGLLRLLAGALRPPHRLLYGRLGRWGGDDDKMRGWGGESRGYGGGPMAGGGR